jgi:tetratricopeptide (TPR) repeat protein
MANIGGVLMRSHLGTLFVVACLWVVPAGSLMAHGGGSMPSSSAGAGSPSMRTPEEMARSAYNSGLHTLKKAQEYDADASKASTPEKIAKAHDKAQKYYHDSLPDFIDAVRQQPAMYEAWNYLGYASRHLGRYDDALSAYNKALEINPKYSNAIEYRGEAYLGLNKVEDAKAAYMTLFTDSRPLADELMTAMRRWADSRRQDSQGLSAEDLDAFAKWMDERSGIAAQTASLAIGPHALAAKPWE